MSQLNLADNQSMRRPVCIKNKNARKSACIFLAALDDIKHFLRSEKRTTELSGYIKFSRITLADLHQHGIVFGTAQLISNLQTINNNKRISSCACSFVTQSFFLSCRI